MDEQTNAPNFRNVHKEVCEKCRHCIRYKGVRYKYKAVIWECKLYQNVKGTIQNSGMTRPWCEHMVCDTWQPKEGK